MNPGGWEISCPSDLEQNQGSWNGQYAAEIQDQSPTDCVDQNDTNCNQMVEWRPVMHETLQMETKRRFRLSTTIR